MKKLAVFCVWFIASLAAADVYKWVDENGKVQFGDKPPAEKSAENIAEELQKINVDSQSSKMTSSVVYSSEKTEDEKALEKKKLAELDSAIGKQCKKMKSDIHAIASGERGVFMDDNGKEEIVLEKERGKKLEEFKERYKKYGCHKLYPLE
jgi:hypothetical protein